jgi:hypothetical protein
VSGIPVSTAQDAFEALVARISVNLDPREFRAYVVVEGEEASAATILHGDRGCLAGPVLKVGIEGVLSELEDGTAVLCPEPACRWGDPDLVAYRAGVRGERRASEWALALEALTRGDALGEVTAMSKFWDQHVHSLTSTSRGAEVERARTELRKVLEGPRRAEVLAEVARTSTTSRGRIPEGSWVIEFSVGLNGLAMEVSDVGLLEMRTELLNPMAVRVMPSDVRNAGDGANPLVMVFDEIVLAQRPSAAQLKALGEVFEPDSDSPFHELKLAWAAACVR